MFTKRPIKIFGEAEISFTFLLFYDKVYYLMINKELKFKADGEPNYVEYGYNYFDLKLEQNINIKNFEGEYEPQI